MEFTSNELAKVQSMRFTSGLSLNDGDWSGTHLVASRLRPNGQRPIDLMHVWFVKNQ